MIAAGNGPDERILAKAPEITGEAFQIVVAHLLVRKDEDMVSEPRATDFGDGGGI